MVKRLNTWVLISYCGLIYGLSNQSGLPAPQLFDNQDKVQHFIAYFVMGILAWRAFAHKPWHREWILWSAFGFCSIYGLSDEWHQSFIAGRDASVLDWIADCLGGLLAAISCYGCTGKFRPSASERA